MTKNDWIILALKLLGVYLFATQIPGFISTVALMFMLPVFDPPNPSTAIAWHGFSNSIMLLAIASLLIFKTSKISSIIYKTDNAEQGA